MTTPVRAHPGQRAGYKEYFVTKTTLALALGLALGSASHAAYAATPSAPPTLGALAARLQALEADADAQRKRTAEVQAALEQARAEIAQLKSARAGVASAPPGAAPPANPEDAVAANPEDAVAANPEDAVAAQAGTSADASTAAENAVASNDGGGDSSNPTAFNPAISIILNGSYSAHSLDPKSYVRSGFPIIGGGGPSAKGFSLGESEVSMTANIDEKFYGQITTSISSDDTGDHLGVEEAFVDTTALPGGLSLRLGRFFSNAGYLNSHHTHSDKFFDRPLPYQAFLGNQYGDDGVQLRWVAPTALFVELGGEIFRGASYPAGGAAHAGAGVKTLFGHVGGDIGTESSWLAGLSVLQSRAEPAEDGFVGNGRLYIADGTWKWAPQGNFKDGGVTVRGEYFADHRNGAYVDPADSENTSPWKGMRRGAYIEGVYRINRQWEAGVRFDKLWSGDLAGPYSSTFDPTRESLAATWINSEFSLVRLQLSHDRPNPDDTDNTLTLQYQVSLGAHGAHKF